MMWGKCTKESEIFCSNLVGPLSLLDLIRLDSLNIREWDTERHRRRRQTWARITGDRGDEYPQNLEWRTPQIVPPRFCNFRNFKHQISCITMQIKAYQPLNFNSVFTVHYFPNVHLQRPPGDKFNIFLAVARRQICTPLRIQQNTPFKVKTSFFLEKGQALPDPFSVGRDTPFPRLIPRSPLQPSLLDPPLRPQNSIDSKVS